MRPSPRSPKGGPAACVDAASADQHHLDSVSDPDAPSCGAKLRLRSSGQRGCRPLPTSPTLDDTAAFCPHPRRPAPPAPEVRCFAFFFQAKPQCMPWLLLTGLLQHHRRQPVRPKASKM
ncbi:unnamed protein product [Urochloa humidicola]